MSLPNFEPHLVPPGIYFAEIEDELEEKKSKFDESKSYFSIPLRLRDRAGGVFSFVWNFSPKSPLYENFLLAIGGQRQSSGIVTPPESYVGKGFLIEITKGLSKNDKSKVVNSVIGIFPSKKNEPVESSPEDEGADIPF